MREWEAIFELHFYSLVLSQALSRVMIHALISYFLIADLLTVRNFFRCLLGDYWSRWSTRCVNVWEWRLVLYAWTDLETWLWLATARLRTIIYMYMYVVNGLPRCLALWPMRF